MIEITLLDPSTIKVTGATSYHGTKIVEIPGREFTKRGNVWSVPLSRLGAIVAICGPGNVSIDYDVFRARDEQLGRMVEQYAACGVRIWMDGGKVESDNELLAQALRPIAKLLAPFLGHVAGPQRKVERNPVRVVEVAQKAPQGAGISLDLWLTGVQNAVKTDERESARKKRNYAGR